MFIVFVEDLLENLSVLSFLKFNFIVFFVENVFFLIEFIEIIGGMIELLIEKGKKKFFKCNVFLRYFIEELWVLIVVGFVMICIILFFNKV